MTALARPLPAVTLRALRADDRTELLAAVRRSRLLHRPWVHPPSSPSAFRAYLARSRRKSQKSFLVLLPDGGLAGVVNVSEIVLGSFRSAYLGYYGLVPHGGRGAMRAGMALVLTELFGAAGLHRVEANIQPGNRSSIALVRALGFRCEGYSPCYLKVGGRWRDHERWALLAAEWRKAQAVRSR
jgi:ribosomal-protein-alanine N-acetyltransferase